MSWNASTNQQKAPAKLFSALGKSGSRRTNLWKATFVVDEELLFNIPFTGCVKLKGIIVIGAEGPFHPAKMRVFKNQPHMTFDMIGKAADQEFDLQEDPTGTLEYAPKVVTFSSVSHLTLHFPTNFGAEQTRIFFIGLKGEFSEAPRQGIVICSYETTPNMADHEVVNADLVPSQVL